MVRALAFMAAGERTDEEDVRERAVLATQVGETSSCHKGRWAAAPHDGGREATFRRRRQLRAALRAALRRMHRASLRTGAGAARHGVARRGRRLPRVDAHHRHATPQMSSRTVLTDANIKVVETTASYHQSPHSFCALTGEADDLDTEA